MSQARDLREPFDKAHVKKAPRGKYGDYVPHHIVTMKLLDIVGPFDFTIVREIRGHAKEIRDYKTNEVKWPARENAVVGAVCELSCTIDGQRVTVSEVGTEDQPAMKHDAEALKSATSDALKRCAMRLGLGLHLWAGDDYDPGAAAPELPPGPVSDEEAGKILADAGFEPNPKRARKKKAVQGKKIAEDEGTDELPVIGPARAKKLTDKLDKEFGIAAKDAKEAAEKILGHKVTHFAQLTEKEAMAVYTELTDPEA